MDDVHLRVPAIAFQVIGYWPIPFKRKFLQLFYKFYHVISLTITIGFICCLCMEVTNMLNLGFARFAALTAVITQFVIGQIKFFVIRGRKAQRLIKKIKFTEQFILKGRDEEVKKMYLEYVIQNRNINQFWFALCMTCDVIFLSAPWLLELRLRSIDREFSNVVVDGYKERPLPLESWLPFNKFKYYKTAYVWNVFGGVYNTLFVIASDGIYFSFIIFGLSQLALLHREIEIAINNSRRSEIAQNLKKAAVYHKNIIRFIEELDEIMSFFLFLGVIICILQVATLSFQIAVEEPSFEMAKNAYLLAAIIVELVLFYWHGNEVCLKSVQIIDIIAKSDWYKLDTSAKKSLLFIMMRAKKPLKLTVGSFYHMSNETMLMIFKSSISYSTALRSVYARKIELET